MSAAAIKPGVAFVSYGYAWDGARLRARLAHYVKLSEGSRKARADEWGEQVFKTTREAQAWSLEANLKEHARACEVAR